MEDKDLRYMNNIEKDLKTTVERQRIYSIRLKYLSQQQVIYFKVLLSKTKFKFDKIIANSVYLSRYIKYTIFK
jgi:hypothetical protein